jgi:hypothetical protein
VSCVNILYICIGLKMFFLICNEVYYQNVCSSGSVKISSALNRSLHELPIMSLRIFFCNVIHTSLKSESKQNELI